MLWSALEDPDPVLIFENAFLYPMQGELPVDAGAVDIDHARVRRPGNDVTIITYGASLFKALVESVPELRELDLNPVKVLPQGQGAIVVDGRMRLGPLPA